MSLFAIYANHGSQQTQNAQMIVGATLNAFAGAGLALATRLVTPVGGAVFAIISRLAGDLISNSFHYVSTDIEKLAKHIMVWLGGALVGMALTTIVGFPIGLSTAATMQIGLIFTSYIATYLYRRLGNY